ncbi:M15 family metallopeptidase [Dactylosporangium sp. NPDC051485]|uniref:M15 family metallopeptidase n=1 Tax=Dactylosporangium sp. NPDC051485 TaxID=3154846 RepID=UPI00342C9E1E
MDPLGVAGIATRVTEIRGQLAAFQAPKAASGTTFAETLRTVQADDVQRYGNGKIPEGALQRVGGTDHRLQAPAATSLEALMSAARRDGVHIGITDSYRSYAEQVDLVRRKGLYSQGGLAAKPGTSDHGWGLAVDLDLDAKAQAWMRANAGRYSFAETTPREPWHWAYRPSTMQA